VYAIIIGGGKVGYYLTKALLEAGYETLLVEKLRENYLRLFDEFGEAVYQGDGDEMRTLQEIGTNRANIFIAVTGDDEDNLIACQLAKKKFGCPKVIARVNNPRNEEIFRQLDIDATVSATRIIYGLVEQEMEAPEVIPLLALKKGNIEIVEIAIPKNAPVVGKTVEALRLPEDCILISIIRGEEVAIPRADTVIEVGDTILALISTTRVHEIHDALLGK